MMAALCLHSTPERGPLAQKHDSADTPLKAYAPFSCMRRISFWHLQPPVCSVSLPCWLYNLCNHVLFLRWKINYNSFISKGSGCLLLTETGWLCLHLGAEDAHRQSEAFLSEGQEWVHYLDNWMGVYWLSGASLTYCLKDLFSESKKEAILALSFIEESVREDIHHLHLAYGLKQKIFYGFISAASLNRLN